MATKNTLEERTMIMKRLESCLGTKRKVKNVIKDKYKQMRSSRQIDKLQQWVMHRVVKDEVLGSILGCNNQKDFFDL